MTNEELWVVVETTEYGSVWVYGPLTRQKAWDLEDRLQTRAEDTGSGSWYESTTLRDVKELTG